MSLAWPGSSMKLSKKLRDPYRNENGFALRNALRNAIRIAIRIFLIAHERFTKQPFISRPKRWIERVDTLCFLRGRQEFTPPRPPCQASLFNPASTHTPPPEAMDASAPKHEPGCRRDSVAYRCTRLIVLSLAGTQVCLRVPLRFATGQPCGRQKYLVLALEAFKVAPRDLEAVAAQIQEDARQSSRAFVPRTTLKRLCASAPTRPKPSKLIEVCVPTPHLSVAPLLPPSVRGCLADIPTHAPSTAPHKSRLSACPARPPACPSASEF